MHRNADRGNKTNLGHVKLEDVGRRIRRCECCLRVVHHCEAMLRLRGCGGIRWRIWRIDATAGNAGRKTEKKISDTNVDDLEDEMERRERDILRYVDDAGSASTDG